MYSINDYVIYTRNMKDYIEPGVTLLTVMQLLLEQVLTHVIMDTFPFPQG